MVGHSDIITGRRARWYGRLMEVFGAARVYRQAFALLRPSAGECILDIGCGTGTFLKLLAKESGIPLELVGVDASEDMLREARASVRGVTFRYADAAELPFQDGTFDCAVSILALHHMRDEVKQRAIGEAIRVLRRNGRIIILDLLRPNQWWGTVARLWLNFHSYTRGNWEFVLRELSEKGFMVYKEGTVRGVVGFLVAKRV